jgi:membrane protein DedA with SNARE-associated domain
MGDLLEQLRSWVEQVIQSIGYVGIALLMFLENIFPPIPSEVVMPFAGSLTTSGELSLAGVLISGTIGALAGAVAIYYIGVWFGKSRVREWFENYGRYLLMSEEDFDKAIDTFNNHGKSMILVGRLMPTIRSLISLPAGLEKMNLPTFLLFTAIGTTIWNGLLTFGGVWMGNNWDQIKSFVDTYSYVFWGIVALLVIYFVVKRWRSYQSDKQAEPDRERASSG